MKPRRYHGLKRVRLRQSWNKYNLFNLYRFKDPAIGRSDYQTFFQQKWRAKGILRDYHGEHVVERKWTRMFSRRLLGVVDMDARYMAEFDGSEMAAGRGSGKDKPPTFNNEEVEKQPLTPYMQMTFAPMERRLDIAVFRAMFASSTRQARQFCVHGAVKVNGKVMPYPAYRLNPGDMFQVDPERVLHATGAPKDDPNKTRNRKGNKKKKSSAADEEEEGTEEAEEEEGAGEEEENASEEPEQDPDTTDKPDAPKVDMRPTREQITELASRAKRILAEEEVGATQKQRLRRFVKKLRSLISQTGRANASPAEIAEELSVQMGGLTVGASDSSSLSKTAADFLSQSSSSSSSSAAAAAATEVGGGLDKFEMKKLEQRIAEQMREEEENPHDPSKPYKTPWRPRNYMSPFAFIPKYLEVNHNVCAAVYLRHPVAKIGRAEVPTPFPEYINQLAFNWYLRRR
ncbi:alpha-L RNA-binding motif-containing protein [Annulohypoxylon truncatum]|uniref:alpha-L RNA-binding motif-containing protein n=1 Tax=Annulohypoxylon truncatum TaxID=327061 RepID=UPI002007990D|nr:alpha-L RNA-binding motif-containing protein [Annulohypoxylon truncatum]KAI1208054.1 alpha-L RNA-binding motif-containing protein [Annulohypoxylon truncatum]